MNVCEQICLSFSERSCSGLGPLSGPLVGRSATGDTEQTRDCCLLKGLLISLALETWLSGGFPPPCLVSSGSHHRGGEFSRDVSPAFAKQSREALPNLWP